MKRIIASVLVLISVFGFASCKSDNGGNGGVEENLIAVSIAPLAFFAEKICADDFTVVTAIPAGASPETYEPTPADMKKLTKAQVYFSIGVGAENSILPYVESETTVVQLHKKTARVYPDRIVNGGRDPHIWLSVKRAKVLVTQMTDIFCGLKPENAEKYKSATDALLSMLDTLDENIKTILSEKSSNKFIAFHPAFGYFADDYSLEMYSLEEDGKEATAKHLADMTDLAKKENIKVIFYQAENSSKQAEAFAEEIGGKAVMLEPLSFDYITNLENMAKAIGEAIK